MENLFKGKRRKTGDIYNLLNEEERLFILP